MPDSDGYPTEQELERLRTWPLEPSQLREWVEYAHSLWHTADWGWPEVPTDGSKFEISTGGWSGNESIIEAMQSAHYGILWHQVWEQTRKGGHYTLRIPCGCKPGIPCMHHDDD